MNKCLLSNVVRIFLDYTMTKLKQEIVSRRKEEFELREFNGRNKDGNAHTEKTHKRRICQKHRFFSKYRPARDQPERSWHCSRKQTLETSIMEKERSLSVNNTNYTYLRTNCVTKKTWVLLQRIILIFMASSLVLVTNMGTTIIYLKDVNSINDPDAEKVFAKTKATNIFKQNSSYTVLSNFVPDIASQNFSRGREFESKISEVTRYLKFVYFSPFI